MGILGTEVARQKHPSGICKNPLVLILRKHSHNYILHHNIKRPHKKLLQSPDLTLKMAMR